MQFQFLRIIFCTYTFLEMRNSSIKINLKRKRMKKKKKKNVPKIEFTAWRSYVCVLHFYLPIDGCAHLIIITVMNCLWRRAEIKKKKNIGEWVKNAIPFQIVKIRDFCFFYREISIFFLFALVQIGECVLYSRNLNVADGALQKANKNRAAKREIFCKITMNRSGGIALCALLPVNLCCVT